MLGLSYKFVDALALMLICIKTHSSVILSRNDVLPFLLLFYIKK